MLKPGGKLHVTSTYTGKWSENIDDVQKWGVWKLLSMKKLGQKRDKLKEGMEILSVDQYCGLMEEAGFVVKRDKILIVLVALSAKPLRGISKYDTFIEGVFADMQNTENYTLSQKSEALIAALDDMEEELRTKTNDPHAVLTLNRNWVEISAQKPPAFSS